LCYYNIGNSLFVRGEYKKAIRCWLRTSELEPGHPQINYRIAQAYWSDGDIESCREHFLAELRLNPGDTDVIFDFGLFMLETGDIESAKEKFNRILELDPNFAAALFYLGEIAFSRRNFKESVALFSRALQKDNTLAGPCYRLAQHALMKEQELKTRAYLVSEMETCPEDADTLVSMGSMFLSIEEVDYAMHCLLRAVDIDCLNADAYYYLGNASAMKNEYNDSVDFFVHALGIRPNHVPTLRDLALVYLKMDKLTDAAKSINKARSLAPDDQELKELGRQVFAARIKQRVTNILCRFTFRSVSKKGHR
jgi:tetratricopeptide (TPR) repeat protein